MERWKLSHALIGIALIAGSLAAMRGATPGLRDAILCAVYAILVTATVGAIVRGRRCGWAGFAAFGWAYFLPIFVIGSGARVAKLPVSVAIAKCVANLRSTPPPITNFDVVHTDDRYPSAITYLYTKRGIRRDGPPAAFVASITTHNEWSASAVEIGHLSLTIVFASVGAIVGRALGRHRPEPGDP